MASKSKDIKDSKVDISKRIEQRVAELKASNSYDPRRENELNEIYDRYVPPHSMAQTSHLVESWSYSKEGYTSWFWLVCTVSISTDIYFWFRCYACFEVY